MPSLSHGSSIVVASLSSNNGCACSPQSYLRDAGTIMMRTRSSRNVYPLKNVKYLEGVLKWAGRDSRLCRLWGRDNPALMGVYLFVELYTGWSQCPYKAPTVCDRSNIFVVGLKTTWGMNVCSSFNCTRDVIHSWTPCNGPTSHWRNPDDCL